MRCSVCNCDPCQTEGFCRACREADAKRESRPSELPPYWDSMDVGALWEALNSSERQARKRDGDAPQSTYDALVWSLIYNKHPTPEVRAGNKRRLARLSDRQLTDLIAALKRKQCDAALIAEIESYA